MFLLVLTVGVVSCGRVDERLLGQEVRCDAVPGDTSVRGGASGAGGAHVDGSKLQNCVDDTDSEELTAGWHLSDGGSFSYLQGPAMVVVPHPDDEVLGFFSLLRSGVETHVVVLTCGDGYDAAVASWMSCGDTGVEVDADGRAKLCQARMAESQDVLGALGAASVVFLGYPDGQLGAIADDGHAEGHGWSDASFRGNPFEREYLVEDLVDALQASGAVSVFTTDPLDSHPDHSATARFVGAAAAALGYQEIGVALVHSTAGEDSWPPPACSPGLAPVAGIFARYLPATGLSAPPDWDGLPWEETTLGLEEAVNKGEAILAYGSQLGTSCIDGDMPGNKWGVLDPCGYMLAFARTNELFRVVKVEDVPSLQ